MTAPNASPPKVPASEGGLSGTAPSPQDALRRCANAVDQTRRDARTFMIRCAESLDQEPPKGSQRARTNDWINQRMGSGGGAAATARVFAGVSDTAWPSVAHLLASADDHSRGLALVLRADPPLIASALTTSRGTVEASVQLCALLDPAIPPEQALLRVCARVLSRFEGHAANVDRFPDTTGAPKKRAHHEVERLRKKFTNSGITVVPDRKGNATAHLEFGGFREPIKFNVSDAVRRYIPDWATAYALGSGAVHSSPWATGAMYGSLAGDMEWPPIDVGIASTTISLSAAGALVRAFSEHLGIDASAELNAIHHRRKAILAMRTGHYSTSTSDEYYSSTVPLPRVIPRYHRTKR